AGTPIRLPIFSVSSIEAQVRYVEELIKNSQIYAPIDGVVTVKKAFLGETVAPQGFGGAGSAGATFAVMVPSASTVAGLAARITDSARDLMAAFWPGLLTLQLPAQPTLAWPLPPEAPVSVRMPLHPLALALLAASGPLVVTTANRPGMSAPVSADDAIAQIGEWVAIALDAGDPIDPDAMASTMIDVTGDQPRLVRPGAVPVDAIEAVLGVPLGRGDAP
ncbi:MAG: Sua5/YciO/YrdC/YwlC family protein, partial [Actinomycetes bacterium]